MQKTELPRIIDQIKRLHGQNWTGIDVRKMLNEIDEEKANTKLLFFTHTIHQVVRHLIADNFLVIQRLQGIDHKLAPEEDWIPAHELERIKWSDTRNALKNSQDRLINALQDIGDRDLSNPILEGQSTIYVNLHGNIQHAYYHIGQISQMKKAIENLKM